MRCCVIRALAYTYPLYLLLICIHYKDTPHTDLLYICVTSANTCATPAPHLHQTNICATFTRLPYVYYTCTTLVPHLHHISYLDHRATPVSHVSVSYFHCTCTLPLLQYINTTLTSHLHHTSTPHLCLHLFTTFTSPALYLHLQPILTQLGPHLPQSCTIPAFVPYVNYICPAAVSFLYHTCST